MTTTAWRRCLAAALGILALAVLAGWVWHVETLKTVLPGMTTMKANTALGFLFSAISVAATGSPLAAVRRLGGAAAVIVGLIGLLTLIEYLGQVRLGIDELLIADPATTSAPFNGRMSPATTIGFVGAAVALLFVGLGASRRAVAAGHALAAVPCVIGLLALIGYAYDVGKPSTSWGPSSLSHSTRAWA